MKLIISDMDGTLLNNNHELSNNTITVLKKIQNKGIGVVLASGRNIKELIRFGNQLDINKCKTSGYITLNGLETYDYLGNCIVKNKRLNNNDLYLFNEIAKNNQVALIIFCDNDYYIIKYGEFNENDCVDTTNYIEINEDIISSIKSDQILKVVLLGHEKIITNTLNNIDKELFNLYEIVMVEKQWVEINPKGITKAIGLQNILKQYHLSLDEIIVFGNGENDLSMLQLTSNSVATNNALDIVKDKVNYICESNDNDGVVQFIKENVLRK